MARGSRVETMKQTTYHNCQMCDDILDLTISSRYLYLYELFDIHACEKCLNIIQSRGPCEHMIGMYTYLEHTIIDPQRKNNAHF